MLARQVAPSGSNQARNTLERLEILKKWKRPTRQFIADNRRNCKEVDSITRLVKNVDGAVKDLRWPGLISRCLRSLASFLLISRLL